MCAALSGAIVAIDYLPVHQDPPAATRRHFSRSGHDTPSLRSACSLNPPDLWNANSLQYDLIASSASVVLSKCSCSRTQVGSAGFFLDLAIVGPSAPGRYLLGIECDGAAYHSARSTRDRDRLRQAVLEGLGWNIHRIWSTAWFRDPAKETEKLIVAIRAAEVDTQISNRPSKREMPA